MVYFVQDELSGHIKIGYSSKTSEERIDQWRTGCPGKVALLMELPRGTREQEQILHARFDKHRTVGEWFKPHADIIQFMIVCGAIIGKSSSLLSQVESLRFLQLGIQKSESYKAKIRGDQ